MSDKTESKDKIVEEPILTEEEIAEIRKTVVDKVANEIIDAMIMGEPITNSIADGKIVLRLVSRLGNRNAMELFYKDVYDGESAWRDEVPIIMNDYLLASFVVRGYGINHLDLPEKDVFGEEKIKERYDKIIPALTMPFRTFLIKEIAKFEKKVEIAMEVSNLINF